MNCTNCNRWDVMLVNGRCSICNGGKAPSLLPAPELKKQGETKKAKRAKQPRQPSSLESAFHVLAKLAALPPYQTEYEFHPSRKWRWDICWPTEKVAVEMDGGIFTKQASHSSISGILRDMEKHNAATILGWRTLRYSTKDLEERPLQVMDEVKAALGLPF